jgi:hypothetical protein
MVEPGRTQMTIRRMRIACPITKVTDTVTISNTHRFSTATMVARMRLNIMFIRMLSALFVINTEYKNVSVGRTTQIHGSWFGQP